MMASCGERFRALRGNAKWMRGRTERIQALPVAGFLINGAIWIEIMRPSQLG
jgi:hypothetical protein